MSNFLVDISDSSLFYMCAVSCLFIAVPAAADTSGGNNGTPGATPGNDGIPENVIRRSPRQQPIMVGYNNGMITVSAKQPYENVVMTIANVETGEQYEVTLGAVEGEVSVPIHLTNGEYEISLICDQNLYSFTISVEEY